MSAPKLTPWFPGEVKPARVGMYQRHYSQAHLIAAPDFWNGKEWVLFDVDGCSVGRAVEQKREWRGLAAKP